MNRVWGFSTSARDLVALGAMVAGVLVGVFAGRPVGGFVLELTGSLPLGTGAWVLAVLVGVALFLGGFSWLLTERRTYRHPGGVVEVHPETEEVSSPRKVESIF